MGIPIDDRTVLALVPVSLDDIRPMDTKHGDKWGSSIRDSSRLQYRYSYTYVQCQYSAAVDTGCLRKTRDLYGLQRKTVLLAVLAGRRTMEVRDWNPGMVRTRWCRACNSSNICYLHTTSRSEV